MKEPVAPLDQTQKRVLALAFGASIAVVLGVSSIMPAIPHMAEVFAITPAAASMLITVFTLPGIALSPLVGLLADRFGRKVILLPSFALFGLAGAACAVASSFDMILFFRFLQGIGASGLGILNTTLIGDVFSGPARARYVGYNMALLSTGTGLYPVIGGFLAEYAWQAPFLLPLLILPLAFLGLLVPMKVPGAGEGFDEYCRSTVKLLSSKRIAQLLGITFITFIMLYGPIITALPLLGHKVFNAPPSKIGMLMMFSSAGTALMALLLGRLSERFRHTTMLLAGQGMFILALLLITVIPWYWALVIPVFFYGVGQGLTVPAIQMQLLDSVEARQRGIVMSVNGMLLRMGQTGGPFLFSSLVLWQGVMAPFVVGAAIAFFTGMFIFLVVRRRI